MKTRPATTQLPVQMDFVHALRMVHDHEIPFVPTFPCHSSADIMHLETKLSYPWAMKAVGKNLIHKTDVGGVTLNIQNASEAILALKHMRGIHGVEYVAVQPMRKGIELIVGGKWDPQFGPTLLVGMGGIYTEVFKDASLRICPVRDDDIAEMVQELKIYPVLYGMRGQKGINLGQLHHLLKNTSRLMMKARVQELDLNPVIATPERVEAVDVRIIENR